jgi:DNA-binding NtrC family response regulator
MSPPKHEPSSPGHRSTGGRGPGRPGASVLLIEDDRDNRESITDALRSEGIGVHPLARATDALRTLDDPGCPGLILLDLRMPEMGGREFLVALGSRPDRERFRVVLMSADPDAVGLASSPRVVELLRKPFGLDRLLATIRRYA